MDEPFAGLTAAEVATFSELIRSFRADGRAVLLVDHNVKGVAALVDRVLAMYLGEHVAEGTADEVMRERDGAARLSRRQDRGGRAPRRRGGDGATAARGRGRQRPVRQGAGAGEGAASQVGDGEFVSVVGLNGAGKTTLFNAISGLVPYTGTHPLRGRAAAQAAAGGDRAAAASCNARRPASCSAT